MPMKAKLFLFALCLFSNALLNAATITVSNDPGNPADYNDLQAAHDAANANDTIQVFGSPIMYSDNLNISKPLTIQGAGNSLLDRVGAILNYVSLSSGAAGTTISGCTIFGLSFENSNDITLFNNSIFSMYGNSSYINEDFLIYNNVIYEFYSGYFENSVVSNNLISYATLYDLSSCEIENNSFGELYILGVGEDLVIRNNTINYVLYFSLIAGNVDLVIENNMISEGQGDFGDENIYTNDFGFVANALNNSNYAYYIAAEYIEYYNIPISVEPYPNFNLLGTSPGKNAGTDGTDIGLYGGPYPFIEGDTSVSGVYRYFPTPEEFADGQEPAPIAIDQTFCTGARVSDLVATGTDIKWYMNAVGGNPLYSNKKLETGVYYCVDALDSESARLAINVTINNCTIIVAGTCGTTLDEFNREVRAVLVPQATQYRFRITNGESIQTLDKTSNKFRFTEFPDAEYNTAYAVDVAILTEGGWSGYGPSCTITTAGPMLSRIEDGYCNSEVSVSTVLYAKAISGATGYRFRVTNGANVATIDRPIRTFKLTMIPNYQYGTSYTIDVAVERDGSYGAYGTTCVVNVAAASTAIQASQCGSTVVANTLIYAKSVPGATAYRFRVNDGATTTIIDRPIRTMKLNMGAYSPAMSFTIDVAVKIGDGEFGEYGSACTVFSPIPTTQLTDEFCGATVTMETVLSVDPIEGAELYGFIVVPEEGESVLMFSESTTFQLSEVPDLPESATYGIFVGAIINEVPNNLGELCTVTIASSGARYVMDGTEGTDEIQDVLAFPNPFSETFSLGLVAGSIGNVNIQVYDTAGRQVEDITLSPSELRSRRIGDNYSAGLYNVVVTQGSYQKSLKMVKK